MGANVNTNRDAALALAATGIPVFPAIVSWNEKAGKLDKRPAITGWQVGATMDPTQIGEWWRVYPEAVPGIELGRAGLVVIDLDRHPGAPDGVAAFKELCGEYRLAEQPVTLTASNGYHVYFKQPDGEPFGNGRGNLPDGIDVRGKGGWVVAPGAVHVRGEWKADPKRPGLGGSIPALPPFLVEKILPPKKAEGERTNGHGAGGDRERKYAEAALSGVAHEIAGTAPGKRNHTLNAIAFRMGHMIARGWIGRATVEGRLYDAAVTSGLVADDGDYAVRGTIKSGLDAGEREPHEDLRDKDQREREQAYDPNEPPRPLMREMPPADPFPIEALGPLAAAAKAIHDRVQAPLAICGQSVLAAATLAVQGHANVELPIGGKRSKPLSSYFVTVAESGERKTEADHHALWAIRSMRKTCARNTRRKSSNTRMIKRLTR
jgi:hypothetical protein